MLLQDRLRNLLALFDRGGIVYLITCTATGPDEGKRYVGLTTQELSERQDGHFLAMMSRLRSEEPLYAAMRQYSGASFTWEVIAHASHWDELRRLERAAIADLGTHTSTGRGFNLTRGGEGTPPLARFTKLVVNEIERRRCYCEERMAFLDQLEERYKQFQNWSSLSPGEKFHLQVMTTRLPYGGTAAPVTAAQEEENAKYWLAWYKSEHRRLSSTLATGERWDARRCRAMNEAQKEQVLQDHAIRVILMRVLEKTPALTLMLPSSGAFDPVAAQVVIRMQRTSRAVCRTAACNA